MGQLEWLTLDIWKQWDKSGRTTFIKKCESILEEREKRARLSFEKDYDDEFSQAIYQLVTVACKGILAKERIPLVMHDLVTMDSSAASSVTDILSLIDQETSPTCSTDDGSAREVFCYIVRNCEGLLGYMLQERLDVETLPDAGVIANGRLFNTRFVRVKTKLYYKQQKFNLLREESEGYSKLISELSQPLYMCSPKSIVEVIQCLIGRFNLDPNRVVDLVLEAFESQPDYIFFISLLNKLRPSSSTICDLLGFKLTNSDDTPSWSLFITIAYLIQFRVISLDEIYPWLTPSDGAVQKDWEREMKDAEEYARKSMIVTINKDAAVDPDTLAPIANRFEDNQKFLLCEALLCVGDWDNTNKLLQRFPAFAVVSKKPIARKLAALLNYLVDPVYRKVDGSGKPFEDPAKLLTPRNALIPMQIHGFVGLQKKIDVFLAIGPYIYCDPVLLTKLLRVMLLFFKKTKTPSENDLYFTFITLLEEVILPGLNFLDGNCCVSEEAWNVIQCYPYHHRFRLYGAWKGEAVVNIHPSLYRRRVDAIGKIKHLMRRISKENVKPMGRMLGKLAHSMPGVIFDYVLSQVQLFDNLIVPVIDALRFLTTLGYDVLTFCLLEALSPASSNSSAKKHTVMLLPNRPRTKHDGSTIAPWLQNLSSFAGAICKKYSLELVPLLQYVANQLKTRQSSDLLLLKEIVQKMAGIEAMEEITEEQLDAMAGGELLRAEAGSFGQIRIAKKSASRLREAASSNDLAVTLCVLMAQQRNGIIYDEAQSLHTKLVGKLYDQCQDTLVQFGSFLASSCTLDDYAKKIPPLQNLVEDYHVTSDVAFFLWRPLFAYDINGKYEELKKDEKNNKGGTVAQRRLKYSEAANAVLDPVAEMMRNHLPAKTWEDISPQFYVTFWSLTLSDLFVPTEAYAREINRVKQASIAFGDNKDLASSKRKKEQEKCTAIIEKLQDEERRQSEHVDRVKSKLLKEKDTWFASRSAKSAKNEAVTAFLQLCLFPRCIFTAPDALYCAHFVHTIHSLSTPNFSTLICYDRIFCDIIYAVTSCTENEANRYGQFLCTLLGTVMKWHSEKQVFNKECASFPGFVTKFRATTTGMAESNDHVDYENYRHVCHKWHYKITKCVIVCLESNDVTQIRNALIVLRRILPHYPRVLNLGSAVERWVERVRGEQKDKRQDLFALATSYIGQLKTRWPSLVAEEEFHQKLPDKPVTAEAKAVKTNAPPPDSSKLSKLVKPGSSNETSKLVKVGETTRITKIVVKDKDDDGDKVGTGGKEKKRVLSKTTIINEPVPSSGQVGTSKSSKSAVNGASSTTPTGSAAIPKQLLESVKVTKSVSSSNQPSVRSVTIKEEKEETITHKEKPEKASKRSLTTEDRTEVIQVKKAKQDQVDSSSTTTTGRHRSSDPEDKSQKKREKKKGEKKRERGDEPSSHASSSVSKRVRTEDGTSSSQKSRVSSTSSIANGEWNGRERSSPKDKDRSPRHSSREHERSSMNIKHGKSSTSSRYSN